jgi:hypothetical protein
VPLSEHEIRSLVAYLASPVQVPLRATPENASSLFNGRDLAGWTGDPTLWRVEDEAIVGRTSGLKRDTFLRSDLLSDDFRLSLKVKIDGDAGRGAILVRGEPAPDGTIEGCRAELGPGHWGTLVAAAGGGRSTSRPDATQVVADDWNTLEIVAVGGLVRTSLNGRACAELDLPDAARRGIFAFEILAGGPATVRFKEIRLELNPKVEVRKDD